MTNARVYGRVMTSDLPGFTEWLDELLEESARRSGDDVATYIARAVATQLVHDRRRADDPVLAELRAHLAESPILAGAVMPDVVDALTDPDRLRALYETALLDTPPDEEFDRISRAASVALEAPLAGLSLVDANRQFLLSVAGGDPTLARQTPLELAICPHVVAAGVSLLISDGRCDPVFKHHPAVRDGRVVAYLGVPLKDSQGFTIGTAFVSDTRPRRWSAGHVQILGDFAAIAAEKIFAGAPS
jgi:hypothetical protein